MSQTWAERILQFYDSVGDGLPPLPSGLHFLNPMKQPDSDVPRIMGEFYGKYYSDHNPRSLILGINPGRLGAGATGIPFTDTKRLESVCGISAPFHTHEPSAVFVHEVIQAYGGAEAFFGNHYISSVCPLGLAKKTGKGEVNFNYYDTKEALVATKPLIARAMDEQLSWGLKHREVICLGTGKNMKALQELNREHQWFSKIHPMEHPRYVMQYKTKSMEQYVVKFLELLQRLDQQ